VESGELLGVWVQMLIGALVAVAPSLALILVLTRVLDALPRAVAAPWMPAQLMMALAVYVAVVYVLTRALVRRSMDGALDIVFGTDAS